MSDREGTMETGWLDHARGDAPTTWPTKADLRNNLGVNNRTIERWAKRPDKLRTQQRRPPGHKSIPIYHPDDVRTLWGQTMEKLPQRHDTDTATATRHDIALTNGHAITPMKSTPPVTATRQATATLRDSATLQTTATLQATAALSLAEVLFEKGTYLTLKEARALTRWSEPALREAVTDGRVLRAPGRTWLLRTVDLLML
jgi:hypothetical protein